MGGEAHSTYLTNDSYDAVKKFYQARFVKSNFELFEKAYIEQKSEEMAQTGTHYGYTYLIEGGEVHGPGTAEVWTFDQKAYNTYLATLNVPSRTVLDPVTLPPFSYLKNEVVQKRHTQAELDKLIARYEYVRHTYYRLIDDGNGKTKPENDVILKKHYERVYGSQSVTEEEKKGPDEKKMKEVREKMKQLKKEGKMAEMIALSQQMQKEMNATPTGQLVKRQQDAQMKAMMTDNWNEWVKCLEELDRASFKTKIILEGMESERKN
ncbi:MAG TPA: hypothetical protein VK470_13505 [Bacteroidota bacterium]|nr:hypothetical protein [Bacteroidota bacterium]